VSSRTLRRPAPHQQWPLGRRPVLLDNISVPATNAYSCFRKLRASYTGPAFRVRRSSDSAEQDIGFTGAILDQAALLAFVGADSGYVSVLYDQSGNVRNLAQATAAAQPRIVNAGVIEKHASGRPAMYFDGVDDRLGTPTGPGLSGNPNVTAGSAITWQSAGMAWSFGNSLDVTAGSRMTMYRAGTGLSAIAKEHKSGSRNFTPISDPGTAAHYYVMQHTAGGSTHSGTLRQDGVDLAGVGAGTNTALVLVDNLVMLGSASSTSYYGRGWQNAFVLFNDVLSGTDLAALEAELAEHIAPFLALDKISVPAKVALSAARQLVGTYKGAAMRVRRSSDNTEQDIGFAGNVLDQTALLAFAGTDSVYVTTLYDQSGNNRHLTQTDPTRQPRIVNAGVVDVFAGGPPAMQFDGVDDKLFRSVAGSALGLSGNPNVTAGSAFQINNSNSTVPWFFGDQVTGRSFMLHWSTSASTSIKKQHSNQDRNHLLVANKNLPGAYVVQHTAGGNTHSGSVRQNKTTLTPGSTFGTAIALNLADEHLYLGGTNGTLALLGKANALIVFNAVLAGADLTTFEDELAAHVAPPVQLALDKISVQPLIAVSASRKLRAAYSGPCMRVRRSTDNAEQDIGFVSNVLDTAALLAFVGSGSGYVRTLYDQGAGARHLGHSDPTRQPIIVNAGALVVTLGPGSRGVPTMDLNFGRTVERADACGMTGAPALTMASRFRSVSGEGYPQFCFFGALIFESQNCLGLEVDGGSLNRLYLGIVMHGPDFAVSPWMDLPSGYYVALTEAGQRNDAFRLRHNGYPSDPLSFFGDGSLPMNLAGTGTGIGGGRSASSADLRYCNGDSNVLMVFNAVLAGADLTALETELEAHR